MRGLFEKLGMRTDDEYGRSFGRCLGLSTTGSAMRRALVMYMFWFDHTSRGLNDLLPKQRGFLRGSIDVAKIEGLEGDLRECGKIWKVLDEGGAGRPRAEMFFVPVGGGEPVVSQMQVLTERESVGTLKAGEGDDWDCTDE
ncbi:uncharacterized protein MYCFIDRAFT_175935 [Pseudocercospora fijiensis CIRAD86]|uniref:Uncharacterized protein n=1 Tax=Pseudocercospora fijiensis (strain CIRAD86) TaxID=383855 RepID=M3AYZ1_PSEFD|nr:uncharacterized protein MYCFIDRAFT_175935 [Pseudocercospora fijiensis CIRAD86]EME82393.1 hypothetical protein MYCFIDRAFT_175935 [Pseudocercospora fijiensis CIRAD86]